MTENKELLTEVIECKEPRLTFGDNSKGRTVGKSKIIHGNVIVKDVLLVENLCYNLINISQLFDNDYSVEFHQHICTVKSSRSDIMVTGLREQNTYRIN